MAGAGVLIAVAYFRTSARDTGATTETALLLTVLLGALAASRPAPAAGAAAGLAISVVAWP